MRRRTVWCSVVVASSLVASISWQPLAAATDSQAPSAEPAAIPQAPAATSAPNEASAVAIARGSGKKVEITGDRTPTSTTYANPDGSLTTTTASGPVRFQDASGNWKDIVLSLVQAKDGSSKAASDAHPATLPAKADGGIELWSPAGTLTLAHAGAKSIAATVTSSAATYSGAVGGADLVAKPLVDGIEESVRLTSAGQGNGYTDVFTLPAGVTAREGGPGIEFVDTSGNVVASFGSGIANDSTLGVAGGMGVITGVNFKLISEANNQSAVQVSVDQSWLNDPRRVFPVTIDPSFVSNGNINLGTDTYIVNNPNIGSEWTNSQLSVGYNNGFYNRTLIKLGLFGKEASNDYVNSATLSVYDELTDTCTAHNVSVLGLTGAFDSNTVWSNQPGHDSTATASQSFAYGLSGCTGRYVNFDVTSLVSTWMNTSRTNYGFELMSTETPSAAGFKRFYSAESGPSTAPTLSVTYDHLPNLPVQMSPPNNSYIKNVNFNLAALPSDEDNDPLTTYYYVTDTGTNTVVINGGQSNTSQPGQMSYYGLAGRVVDGHTYSWYVKSDDHNAPVFGPSTGLKYFTVDTTAPSAPGVSSTLYPSGQWHTAGGSGTFNLTHTAGDFDHYLYGLDQNPPTTSTTAASVTLTPPDGWHTLYVEDVDHAGNVSTPVAYTFGATPAVTGPADGATTQGSVVLAGRAAPGFANVTYNFRGSSSDSWTAIPVGDVTFQSTGLGIGSWPVTITGGGDSIPPALVWNVAHTLNDKDGPVQIQACFAGTCGVTPINLTLDENEFGTSYSTANIGPGTVSLLTGNYSVSATDATISAPNSDLTIGRTFNSRTPSTTSIFGPGWQPSLPDATASSDWANLTDTGSSVTLAGSDGSKVSFAKTGSTYTPTGGATGSNLKLTASSGTNGPDTFTLTDPSGNSTQFAHTGSFASPASLTNPHAYSVNTITQPGSSQTTTYTYDGSGRPIQVLAPIPAGATCTSTASDTTWTPGCRALQLTINGSGQVTTVTFATNTGAGRLFIDVACYSYYANGRLQQAWDPRFGTAGSGNHPITCGTAVLPTAYGYDTSSGRLTSVTPAGLSAWNLAYDGNGRLSTVSRTHDAAHGSGTETTTMIYGAALAADGTHPEYRPDMTPSTTATWAQIDNPVTATVVYPPGHTTSSTDLRDGTIHYIDVNGQEVNTASYAGTGAGGWHISTAEYDNNGRVVRTLTAANREEALNPTGSAGVALGLPTDTATASTWLDTRNSYTTASDGVVDLTDTYGPYHQVMLPSASGIGPGTPTFARQHTHYSYDTGTETGHPSGGSLHLVVKTTEGASQSPATTSTSEADIRETDNAYALSATDNAGWTFRQPMKVTTDPLGLNISTIARYDSTTGLPIEARQPADPNGTTAATTLSRYYTADASSPDTDCRNKPQWAGLMCKTTPAAQPGISGLPGSVTKWDQTYDYLDRPTTVLESVTDAGGTTQTRTTTTSYDSGGYSPRPYSIAVTGGLGTAIPNETTTYDTNTGLPTTRTASATATQATTSAATGYDDFGRTTSYNEDTTASGAAANAITIQYDSSGRLYTVTDAHTTKTYTYNANGEHRNLPTGLTVDGIAGSFSASYDANGALANETYPTGMTQVVGRDESGQPTTLTDTSSGSAVWFSDSELASIHGQELARATTNGSQYYNYDVAGRLSSVQDSPTGAGCTTRTYAYDADTNRTSATNYPAAADNSCQNSTGAVTVNHTYDTADRLQPSGNDAGLTYDAFGRTTTVPANDAGNTTQNMTVGYYTNDLVRSQTQGTRTLTWSLDAAGRLKTWTDVSNGVTNATKTNHYDEGSSDSPAWIAETADSSQWTRNIGGLDGDLALTASQAGSTTWELTDLKGSVAATTPDGMTQPTYEDAVEFGNPRDSAPRRYNWLGGVQRSADDLGGAVLMGVRLYEPTLGRFLQVDPVVGGSANVYDYVSADPLNRFDPTGRYSIMQLNQYWKDILEAYAVVRFLVALYKWYRRLHQITYAFTWIMNQPKSPPSYCSSGTFNKSQADAMGFAYAPERYTGC